RPGGYSSRRFRRGRPARSRPSHSSWLGFVTRAEEVEAIRIREGMIDVPGGRVWYRSVGEGGIPLLCLHGGPGMTHNYIDPLEDLGDRRRVIFYDQLGCGRSDKPDDTSLWTVPHFVREVEAVRSALELDRFHLFGSSWGGQPSMQY